MKYECITVTGKIVDLGYPISVKMNKSSDTPVDDLYAVFCYTSHIEELKYIKIYFSDEIIFDGIIDEQIVEISDLGILFKIYARSMAALLVDNCALPQTYINTSLETIFNRHVKPYGFTNFIGNNKCFSSEFIVYKGMSEWDVLKDFCEIFLNTKPKVTYNGVINALGTYNGNKNVCLNNSSENIKYKSISRNIKRYNKISEIFVKANGALYYDFRVADESAVNAGVKRKRYLNISDDVRTPVGYAQSVIDEANRKANEIVVSCVGFVNTDIGCTVQIDDKILGKLNNMFISKMKYTMDSYGEITELTMFEGK